MIDSDVVIMHDPYKYFKHTPFKEITVLNQAESPVDPNGGLVYVQNAAPDGPAAFMFAGYTTHALPTATATATAALHCSLLASSYCFVSCDMTCQWLHLCRIATVTCLAAVQSLANVPQSILAANDLQGTSLQPSH